MREQYLEWYYLLCLRIKSLGLPYNDSAAATSCWTLGGLELPLKLYPSGNDKIDKISIVSLTHCYDVHAINTSYIFKKQT